MNKNGVKYTQWSPVESGGLRWIPVDSGGLRWTPVDSVDLVDSGGLWWTRCVF